MPTESDDNGKMHEVLKAYADQRRKDAGSGKGLHPATRRLLQDEVRRQYPAPPPGRGWGAWLLARWLRLAFAGGALTATVVVLLALLWRSPDTTTEPMRLALKNTPPPPAQPAPALAPPTSEPAQPKEVGLDLAAISANESQPKLEVRQRKDSVQEGSVDKPVATVASTAVPRQQVDLAAAKRVGGAGTVTLADQPPAGPAPGQAPAAELKTAPAPVAAMEERELQLNPVERYVFRADPNRPAGFRPDQTGDAVLPAATTAGAPSAGAQGVAGVLNRFQFEVSGDQVRLIDDDSSVYAGKLLLTAETDARARAAAVDGVTQQNQNVAAGRATFSRQVTAQSQQNARGGLNFRVVGTNRTLRQPVQFDGVLVPVVTALSNPEPGRANTGAETLSVLQNAPRQTTSFQLQQAPAQAPAPTPKTAGAASDPLSIAVTTPNTASVQNRSSNYSAFRRIQGTLQIGATNRVQVDAYRAGD